jgi:hypothetical protein
LQKTEIAVVHPEELADAGRALYGDRWQTPLARDLRVTDRTMRRWLAGEFAIPPEAERGIRSALEGRLNAIGSIVKSSINPRTGRSPASVTLEHGFMKGTVIIPSDIDLTEPVIDEPFDAEDGVLHR